MKSEREVKLLSVADQAAAWKPISGHSDSPAFGINYLLWQSYSGVELCPFGTGREGNI